MKYLQPFYYEDFKCIGSECSDNCCKGWNVYIEKESYLKYKNIKGEFGKRLNKAIKRNRKFNNDRAYGSFILDKGQCQMLNEEGLCDLFINAGEKALCDICTFYPRVCIKYKNNIEKNLNLSCPVVARKLIECTEKFSFILNETQSDELFINSEILEDNDKLYNMLWDCRSVAIDIAQLSELPMWKRIVLIKFLEERLQKIITNGNLSDYEKVIDEFNAQISSFADAPELQNTNSYIKIQIIAQIINDKIFNEKLKKLMSMLLEFINGKTVEEVEKALKEKENEFNKYFKDREYILENYIVYLLYSQFMNVMTSKDLHREIVLMMINYACMKSLIMAKWMDNDGVLSEEDIIEVLYSTSKTVEHSDEYIDIVYKWLINNGLDNSAYLATLIY